MFYSLKGRLWFSVGTGLMIASILIFLWVVFKVGYPNSAPIFTAWWACFLSAGIFRVYTITPLMSPGFALKTIVAIFCASQIFTLLSAFGYFLLGFILGNLLETLIFNYAYQKSKELYYEAPP